MSSQTECPVCWTRREFPENIAVGDRIICLECGRQLRVRSLAPLRVEEAAHQGESWGE